MPVFPSVHSGIGAALGAGIVTYFLRRRAMLYQEVVLALWSLMLLNLLLNLRALKKPRSDIELPEDAPLISVLIPARNEEANIGTCLESLRHQDYPNFEILVLDDSSTDSTADIVARIAAEDSRVRLLRGQALPQGWKGKTFACHQLAQNAQGSWLLFTDADSVHASSMLRRVLGAALVSKPALVSGLIDMRITSIWGTMVLPIMCYWVLLCGMPLWFLQRYRRDMPSLAIGSFLFFSANEYRSIGGHEAVKSRMMEDVSLGIEVSRHHYTQLTLDLSSLVSCETHREFGAVLSGARMWAYAVASMAIVFFVGMVAVGLFLFVAPFVWLAYGLLLAQPAFAWEVLVMLQVAIMFLGRFLVGRRFSQPKISPILHPVGVLFIVLMVIHAGFQYLRGGGVKWKERTCGPEGEIP